MQKIITHENWIGDLPRPAREAVLSRMTEIEVAAGERIAEAGRPATRIFQVAEGYVRLVGLHEDGNEAFITIFIEGNCFAETAMVSRRPYNHSSIAMVRSRIRVLHENDFWDLYHTHSEIPEALCRKFAGTISRQFTAREMRATMRLRVQIANMFADFARKCAGDVRSGPIELDFPFTQSDIASIFDVTRQSVQREITHLKERNLVEKRDGSWTVLDLARLTRVK